MLPIPNETDPAKVLENCNFLYSVEYKTRAALLPAMVSALAKDYPGISESAVLASVLEREQIRSTGTPEGVAFPHGKHESIDGICVAIATARHGIDFGRTTPMPCRIIVLTLSSLYRADGHLHFLAHMAGFLRFEAVRSAVLAAKNKAALLDALHQKVRLV